MTTTGTSKRTTKSAAERAQEEVDVLTKRVKRLHDAMGQHEVALAKARAEHDEATQLLDHAKGHPALKAPKSAVMDPPADEPAKPPPPPPTTTAGRRPMPAGTPTPYYADESVRLFLGDCRDVLDGETISADSCVTDPPYGETAAVWDRWPDGWVDAVGASVGSDASLWCFGSARMFLTHRDDFAGWKYGQEALWVKRNGSGPGSRDRLVKLHEWAYHWYRGKWSALHHEWPREAAQHGYKGYVRRDSRAAVHQRPGRQNAWQDDGTRQPRSVTFVIEEPSVRYQQRHQDEKPLRVTSALVRECTPPGGIVLDPFAGTGTVGVVARHLGLQSILIEADEAMCEIAAKRLSEPDLFRAVEPA